MMDPTIPDSPAGQPASAPKNIQVSPSSSAEPPAENALPSAPELPDAQPQNADAPPVATPAKAPAAVKQITITEHSDSPTIVAEKLDEAIAGLGSQDQAGDEMIPDDGKPIEGDPALAAVSNVTDPETDKAVDDIVAGEGDELLEVEDAIRDSDQPAEEEPKPKKHIAGAIRSFFARPVVRWGLLLALLVGIITAVLVPTSRYFVLNTAGVHASSSLSVVDESTGQPLKNVHVQIGSVSVVTDASGTASLKNIKLGPQTLLVEKRAFAPVSKTITLGLGSNPLGDFELKPTGSQYTFTITDYLSKKPIAKALATGNGADASADDKGAIKLTIDKPDEQKIQITVQADNYRSEQVMIDPADKGDHVVRLVPARKQLFVSKRSGKYDIYSVYIDGKDEKLVLAGSGSEQESNMVLVPHPSEEVVAYVSNRGNQHNGDGFLLSNLVLINTTDNTTTAVATSERIQIVDWAGDRLVYVQIAAGASADSPKRYRLVSYDFKDGSSKELASANYFNDVTSAQGAIYYAPSSAYQTTPTNFYKINADGSSAQTVFGQEVWNIFRTAYDHMTLSVQQQWYDYHLGDKAPIKLNNAPVNQTSRIYIDSPDGKHSAWVDKRDGKGVILIYDLATKTDTTLRSQSGITYPVRWLNDSVLVYRVKTDQETADYAISLDGGDPIKVKDVTNSTGISSWYYY